jgi:hypothetical protein
MYQIYKHLVYHVIHALKHLGALVPYATGKLTDTHYPHPTYLNLNPKYSIPNLDSNFDYLELVWVIRVIHSAT